MRIDDGYPVDNETPAVRKKRNVEQLTPVEAVRAYASQPVGDKPRDEEYPSRRQGQAGFARDRDVITDLQGIDIEQLPEAARRAFRHLADDIAHLQEELAEARHHIDYLEDKADHDAVSGCLRRSAFAAALDHVLALDRQNQMHSSLALLALPGWLAIRRDAGLEAAEELAREVGDVLRTNLRTGDLMARVDDGVFGVVFVASGQAEAQTLLAPIRQALEALELNGHRLAGFAIVSVLVGDESGETALARADGLLTAEWRKRGGPVA